jgi:predicted AAA+ superfamily ATPase
VYFVAAWGIMMDKSDIEVVLNSQRQEILSITEPLLYRTTSLAPSLEQKEITVITGVRRCGKSTLLHSMLRDPSTAQQTVYLNFDDPLLHQFTHDDFKKLYDCILGASTHPIKFVLFDEVQNVPGWEKWINYFSEQKRLKVIITGSNSNLLSSELATHLTGRHSTLKMFPLSFFEVIKNSLPLLYKDTIEQKTALTAEQRAEYRTMFLRYFQYGGFPRAWLMSDTAILAEYYENIVFKDIVRRKRIKNPELIRRLGAILMTDMSRKINKTKLAKDLAIKDPQTISKHIAYFAESYLGFEITKYSSSVRAKYRNQSKFYCIDAALCRRNSMYSRSRDGAYFENIVYIELIRRGYEVSFIHNSSGTEIDFVAVMQSGARIFIQVASSLENVETEQRELQAFKDLSEDLALSPEDRCIILTLDEQRILTIGTVTVSVMPFYVWSLSV